MRCVPIKFADSFLAGRLEDSTPPLVHASVLQHLPMDGRNMWFSLFKIYYVIIDFMKRQTQPTLHLIRIAVYTLRVYDFHSPPIA